MELVLSQLNNINTVAKSSKLQFTNRMKDDVSNEQLMLQYAKGDAIAFEVLYARHKGGLYRYCLRLLRNEAQAEECFQEIWMKLINSRVNYQPTALFTTYFYRIAHNHIIDSIRKEKKRQQDIEFDESSEHKIVQNNASALEQTVNRQSQQTQMRNAIYDLPAEQKTALLLKLDAGLSLEEIANVLNCGRETIKSRLRYAMAKLKEAMEKNDE